MAAAGPGAPAPAVPQLPVDEEVLRLLSSAAVMLGISAGAPPIVSVCAALAHAGHKTVPMIMSWDICRLGDAETPRREDKVKYIDFLRDGPADRLGTDPRTPDLVAVFTDKVVAASRRRAANLAAATKQAEGTPVASIDNDAEDRAAIKSASLYEEFGAATNTYLEAWLRHRKADSLYKAYGSSHRLGVFPSWSEITVMGVQRKREHRLALSGPGGPYSAALVMGDRGEEKVPTHSEARTLGYIITMLLGVVLGQKIPDTLYPGYEKHGFESLPGKTGKVRLGMTNAVRERLVQKILCMDGEAPEYLARVDSIMNILVNQIDQGSRHPDEIVRGIINESPHLFMVSSKPTDLPPSSGGAVPAGKRQKHEPPRDPPPSGGAKKGGGLCPGWVHNGTCSAKGGRNKCGLQHPDRLCGAMKKLKSNGGEASGSSGDTK